MFIIIYGWHRLNVTPFEWYTSNILFLQSWTKVLETVPQYSYFSVISRFPLKTVHHLRNFLALLPPPSPHSIQSWQSWISYTRVQQCLWGEGRVCICFNVAGLTYDDEGSLSTSLFRTAKKILRLLKKICFRRSRSLLL